jgi:hypothetical protein
LTVVKTSEGSITVPSPALLLDIGMATTSVGCESRATLKVVVPPASVVFPAATLTVIPALSLSTLTMTTSGASSAS